MMASKLNSNFRMTSFNTFQFSKYIQTVCMNNFRLKLVSNNYVSAKELFSNRLVKFYINSSKNYPHILFYSLTKLWKEMSIFLTSTFKRKKLKMKKHKTAKRIKELRNIQKSNLKKK